MRVCCVCSLRLTLLLLIPSASSNPAPPAANSSVAITIDDISPGVKTYAFSVPQLQPLPAYRFPGVVYSTVGSLVFNTSYFLCFSYVDLVGESRLLQSKF